MKRKRARPADGANHFAGESRKKLPWRREMPPKSSDPPRPRFARDYPKQLDELVAAFEAGNYALVRREAGRIAGGDGDAKLKAAARDLVSRTEPDRMQLVLLGVALALLVGLAGYWIAHQEPPKTPAKNAVPTSRVETPK